MPWWAVKQLMPELEEGLFGRRYNYLFQDNVDTWTLGMGENNSLRENNSWWAGEYVLFGIFARADYSYSDKYLLTTTIRRDGTSRFQKIIDMAFSLHYQLVGACQKSLLWKTPRAG